MFNDSNHGDVQTLSFHPDSALFAAAGSDGVVRTYDLRKPYSNCVFTTAADEEQVGEHLTPHPLCADKPVLGMCFSTHARMLYTCHAAEKEGQSTWCIWDAYTGDFVDEVPSHTHWTTAIDTVASPPVHLALPTTAHDRAEHVMTGAYVRESEGGEREREGRREAFCATSALHTPLTTHSPHPPPLCSHSVSRPHNVPLGARHAAPVEHYLMLYYCVRAADIAKHTHTHNTHYLLSCGEHCSHRCDDVATSLSQHALSALCVEGKLRLDERDISGINLHRRQLGETAR